MATVTSIGDARTPATPVEQTFAADTGQPAATQEVLLMGKRAASGGTATNYRIYTISNSGDAEAALLEAEALAGDDSEAALMVYAAVKANAGASTYPQIKLLVLANADTTLTSALAAAVNIKAEFIVSPFDGVSGGSLSPSAQALRTHATTVSGATRTANNQFGSFGVVFNRSVADPATLPTPDSQYLIGCYLYDSGSPAYSIGEMAAACAARMAANAIPFNPLDDETIQSVTAPALQSNWPSVGDNAQSESALQKGWTPLYVKPNEEVAFVRSITSRLSVDGSGSPVVNSYYDVQDFQVLYYWRKTVYTRLSQRDFRKKASGSVANRMKGELVRLAAAFEDQDMFQATALLAKQFVVQRASTDRHAFEVKTPVNVVPGLHRKKVNVEATTEFDSIVV